jgi:site-specific DNA-adenine methylase
MQRDQEGDGSSTSNLEKRHESLLGLYIVIGKGINTSLLKYYKVLRCNYSGLVHVVRTTTMTG